MEFNFNSYGYVDTRDLRFTQSHIRPSFKKSGQDDEDEVVNVEEAVRRIRKRRQDPAALGAVKVHRDDNGVLWCFNNRRLYVLRKAGVRSVKVKFVSKDYISRRKGHAYSKEGALSNPAFCPQIRRSASGVRIPPRKRGQEHESSFLGLMALMSGHVSWRLRKPPFNG